MPSKKLAGLLAAGIVSDTIVFKSRRARRRPLYGGAYGKDRGALLEELGREILSCSRMETPISRNFIYDFKQFQIAGTRSVFRSSQIAGHRVDQRAEAEFLALMEREVNGTATI
jgi:manganese-dependent inorganic pyrophosphatase